MTVSGWKIITAVRHWGHVRSKTTQKNAVLPLESRLVPLTLEHGELVPQSYILQANLVMGSEPGQKVAQERQSDRQYGCLA